MFYKGWIIVSFSQNNEHRFINNQLFKKMFSSKLFMILQKETDVELMMTIKSKIKVQRELDWVIEET